MNKTLIPLIMICFLSCTNAQKKETIHQTGMLTGVVKKEDFKEQPYAVWFEEEYNYYSLDEKTIQEIKKHLKDVKIKAFMGTWCSDSKREIPQFYKILEAVDFNEKNLTMIAVDRSKKTPENLQEGLDIMRVPTFIFYKVNKEIGRYVEYPQETLEKDMLKILSGKPYKHSYETN